MSTVANGGCADKEMHGPSECVCVCACVRVCACDECNRRPAGRCGASWGRAAAPSPTGEIDDDVPLPTVTAAEQVCLDTGQGVQDRQAVSWCGGKIHSAQVLAGHSQPATEQSTRH